MASQHRRQGDGTMSVRAISWAYGQNLGSASQKAVLLHLAYLAREEDNCAWPHVTRIQAETELSERTVRKALKALQDKGLIALGDSNPPAKSFRHQPFQRFHRHLASRLPTFCPHSAKKANHPSSPTAHPDHHRRDRRKRPMSWRRSCAPTAFARS